MLICKDICHKNQQENQLLLFSLTQVVIAYMLSISYCLYTLLFSK